MNEKKNQTDVVCAATAVATACANGAMLPSDIMRAKTFTSSDGQKIPYRFYAPEGDRKQKIPLILFLHGAGERGNNNSSQLLHCVPSLLRYIIDGKHPAIVIAPQCPNGMQWVNTPFNDTSHTMPEKPSKALQAVIELLHKEISANPVDESRIYVSGISMGGFGTWDLLQRFPEKFAAAFPICGGGDCNLASRLIEIPIVSVHGTEDASVPVMRTSSMFQAIKKAGGTKMSFIERRGEGHNVWTDAYDNDKNLDWLFSQRRGGK